MPFRSMQESWILCFLPSIWMLQPDFPDDLLILHACSAASGWIQCVIHVCEDVSNYMSYVCCRSICERLCSCQKSIFHAHTSFSLVRRLMCSIVLSRTDSLSCFADGGMIERRVSMRCAILSLCLCICIQSTQGKQARE